MADIPPEFTQRTSADKLTTAMQLFTLHPPARVDGMVAAYLLMSLSSPTLRDARRLRAAVDRWSAVPSVELARAIEDGLPYIAILRLQELGGFSLAELSDLLDIPERTLARRREAGRLTREESELVLRTTDVINRAFGLFEGNLASAIGWLRTPRSTLANRSPFELLKTSIGAREVVKLIERLEHGNLA